MVRHANDIKPVVMVGNGVVGVTKQIVIGPEMATMVSSGFSRYNPEALPLIMPIPGSMQTTYLRDRVKWS
jgi:hypothetical protein